MLKQVQKLKQQQKLLPQQIQVFRLLELPVVQLEQKIKKELEENPMLEEITEDENFTDVQKDLENDTVEADDEDILSEDSVADNSIPARDEDNEFSVEDYIQDEDIPYYKLSANNSNSDNQFEEIPYAGNMSFSEYLESQLSAQWLNDDEFLIGRYIIGNLDDDGYLRRDLAAIADDLAFNENVEVSVEKLQKVLQIIQQLDPPGIGARDLKECLLLQLKRIKDNSEHHKIAIKIIEDYYDEFLKKHYDKIQQLLGISEKGLKIVLEEIVKLNPKPGNTFYDPATKSTEHITPDFILENRDGELFLSLNSKNIPELKINDEYLNMISSGKKAEKSDKEAINFVKGRIAKARNFIDALKQRHVTMLAIVNALIKFQRAYFLSGDESKLKPMILKDVADIAGYDISTVSRVINSKYIQTQFGVFSLKSFFSEGMQFSSGEEVSSIEIKSILKECIESEDKKNPLTDEELGEVLKKKGYPIARRTVAKYREQLGLPIARLRKKL